MKHLMRSSKSGSFNVSSDQTFLQHAVTPKEYAITIGPMYPVVQQTQEEYV
jgi:hypothetical protein